MNFNFGRKLWAMSHVTNVLFCRCPVILVIYKMQKKNKLISAHMSCSKLCVSNTLYNFQCSHVLLHFQKNPLFCHICISEALTNMRINSSWALSESCGVQLGVTSNLCQVVFTYMLCCREQLHKGPPSCNLFYVEKSPLVLVQVRLTSVKRIFSPSYPSLLFIILRLRKQLLVAHIKFTFLKHSVSILNFIAFATEMNPLTANFECIGILWVLDALPGGHLCI